MSTVTETTRKSKNLPPIPLPFNDKQPKTIRVYPVSNYTFGVKDFQPEEDGSVMARLQRLQDQYEGHGMRRTCEAILVCHEHGHPYILMLQIANTFFKLYVKSLLSSCFYNCSSTRIETIIKSIRISSIYITNKTVSF